MQLLTSIQHTPHESFQVNCPGRPRVHGADFQILPVNKSLIVHRLTMSHFSLFRFTPVKVQDLNGDIDINRIIYYNKRCYLFQMLNVDAKGYLRKGGL